jgi:hypothetical protein
MLYTPTPTENANTTRRIRYITDPVARAEFLTRKLVAAFGEKYPTARFDVHAVGISGPVTEFHYSWSNGPEVHEVEAVLFGDERT